MGYAKTNEDVLRLVTRVLKEDLELHGVECDHAKRRVRVQLTAGGHKYSLIYQITRESRVLQLYTFLPFDVEDEEHGLLMAKACNKLNSSKISGKYCYNLDKDVDLEFSVCFRDGIGTETVRLITLIMANELEENGARLIDLHQGKLSFSRFCSLLDEA